MKIYLPFAAVNLPPFTPEPLKFDCHLLIRQFRRRDLQLVFLVVTIERLNLITQQNPKMQLPPKP